MGSEPTRVARDFLTLLYGPRLLDGAALQISWKTNSQPGMNIEFFAEPGEVDIKKYPLDGHIYFGVALRDGKGSSMENLTYAPAVWVDFDRVEDKVAVVNKLKRWKHPPSIIVDSGGGIHAYWLFDKMLDLRDGSRLPYLREVAFGLAHVLGSDPTVHDPTRILRLPGTYNVGGTSKVKPPYNPPRAVEVLFADGGIRYSPADLGGTRRTPPSVESERIAAPAGNIEVDLSRLPDKWQGVIRTGFKRGMGYPTRSELDMKVMIEMVRAGYSDDEVFSVFRNPAYKISDKFLDKEKDNDGDRYLGITLGKARERVEQQKDPETDVRIVDGGVEVWRGDRDGWVRVLDRPIEVIASLTGARSGYRFSLGDGRSYTIYKPDFATATAFKRPFNDADIYGKHEILNNDVQRIGAFMRDVAPTKYQTYDVMGWHGRDVIFPTTALIGGNFLDHYDPASKTGYLYAGVNDYTAYLTDVAPGEFQSLATGLLGAALKMHDPHAMAALLGWFMSTFVAPSVRRVTRVFPPLMVYGLPRAGKTTILEDLWLLTGATAHLTSAQPTPFAALAAMSGSNTLPMIMDEFRYGTKLGDLLPSIRKNYNGVLETRGTKDQKVNRYQHAAPVCVAGESPFRDEALVDRSIHIRLEKSGKDEAAHDAFMQLTEDHSATTKFACGMYRHVADMDVGAAYREALAFLPKAMREGEDMQRQRIAWAVTTMGLLLVRDIVPDIMDVVPQFDKLRDFSLEDVTKAGTGTLDEIVRIMVELMKSRRIQEGRDYVMKDNLLWFVPATVVPLVAEYAKREGSEMSLGKEAITARFRDDATNAQPIVAHYQQNFRIAGRVLKGNALDLVAIEQRIGIPASIWSTQEIV